ncbi:MAG: NAD-dependent epimerase/dehydratase family protein [Sulfitobacter sp.]
MTRVLVIGSSGRVGRMVRRSWDDGRGKCDSFDFTFQTRRSASAQAGDLFWDIMKPLPDVLRAAKPFDCMIVLVGVVPEEGADVSRNTDLGLACINAAGILGIGHVLLASSSAVYGAHQDAPFRETDDTKPVNAYGRTKLEMEGACHAAARALGIGLCCLRIGNVAGADALLRSGADLVGDARLALDRFLDGSTPVRSYIGPRTLGDVLLNLVAKRADLPEILNVAAPAPVEMHALAQVAGFPVDLRTAPPTASASITLDCNRLCALHDFVDGASDPRDLIRQWHSVT